MVSGTLMRQRKILRRRKIIGYAIIGALIVGLVILYFWLVIVKPGRRFPGIEKFRTDFSSRIEETQLSRQFLDQLLYHS